MAGYDASNGDFRTNKSTMPRYVAFLRGINLGKRRLQMSRLAELFEELGFDAVTTFIASGNVLFSSKARKTAELEARIAAHLASSLGYDVDTFVRTLQEVVAVGALRAFAEDGAPGITVHVAFLQKALAPDIARKLGALSTDSDAFRVNGREYYWLCRIRTPDSKVWALPEFKALCLPRATMRNMTSIRKLVAKHAKGD